MELQKSENTERNLARVDAFAAHNSVLNCDTAVARHYGEIKSELRTKGRPIPENDIWIAALAREHQLTLATRDNHFSEVDGLSIAGW